MLYFIHGLNGGPEEWDMFIDIFTSFGFSCKAIDLMGGMDLRKTRFQDYVNKVVSFVTKEDILIGHSMGGLVVQKVAEQTKIKAGVCLCPAAPKGIEIKRLSILAQLRYVPFILFKRPFKPPFHIAHQIFLDELSEEEAKKPYDNLKKQSAMVTYEVLRSKIPVDENKITCPLFFIARRHDKIIPLHAVEKIAEKYHAPLTILDGNHHIYPDAKKIAPIINDIIKSIA